MPYQGREGPYNPLYQTRHSFRIIRRFRVVARGLASSAAFVEFPLIRALAGLEWPLNLKVTTNQRWRRVLQT
jgi:hypothetical protein